MTPDIEAILNEHIKLEQERVPGYAFHHWEATIAGIPEASAAIKSLLAEKDAEIEKLRKDKDWLWQVNQQKDKQFAQLNSSEPNASFLDKIEAFSKKHPDIFNDEPTYPCEECGLLRTEAQGGTTFTVCDACWDKHYKKLNSGDPLPGK